MSDSGVATTAILLAAAIVGIYGAAIVSSALFTREGSLNVPTSTPENSLSTVKLTDLDGVVTADLVNGQSLIWDESVSAFTNRIVVGTVPTTMSASDYAAGANITMDTFIASKYERLAVFNLVLTAGAVITADDPAFTISTASWRPNVPFYVNAPINKAVGGAVSILINTDGTAVFKGALGNGESITVGFMYITPA